MSIHRAPEYIMLSTEVEFDKPEDRSKPTFTVSIPNPNGKRPKVCIVPALFAGRELEALGKAVPNPGAIYRLTGVDGPLSEILEDRDVQPDTFRKVSLVEERRSMTRLAMERLGRLSSEIVCERSGVTGIDQDHGMHDVIGGLIYRIRKALAENQPCTIPDDEISKGVISFMQEEAKAGRLGTVFKVLVGKDDEDENIIVVGSDDRRFVTPKDHGLLDVTTQLDKHLRSLL